MAAPIRRGRVLDAVDARASGDCCSKSPRMASSIALLAAIMPLQISFFSSGLWLSGE
jgi:hypothetical protein